jgi:hypothetical protein
MRTRLLTWRSSLYAALGLAAFACGGQTAEPENAIPGSGGTQGGAGGSGGGPGGTAGSGGRGGSTAACLNPKPVNGIFGTPTSFISCEGGFVHRPARGECPSILPRPDLIEVHADAAAQCTRDQDCTDRPHGYCVVTQFSPSSPTVCAFGCVRDEDCGPGTLCFCGDPVGTCVGALCTTDADCTTGSLCTSSAQENPCGESYMDMDAFACQSPADTCRGKDDCTGTATNCSLWTPARQCMPLGMCGRPFLVGGEPRLASLTVHAGGWSSSATPSLGSLGPAQRSALAEHWSRNGLMEHASVAAFARFTLELLALGAPAALVRGSQQALGDEIAHAELCFGLASAYAGHAIQPGPLPMNGALADLSFVDIMATAIAEACIGETLAAVEAAEAAAHARDPEVRTVLERIAADEARHAELGWKFLRWALGRATPAQRHRLSTLTSCLVATELEQAAYPAGHESDRLASELLAHGVLTPQLRSEVRRTALEELVEPLARTLFGTFARAPALDASA